VDWLCTSRAGMGTVLWAAVPPHRDPPLVRRFCTGDVDAEMASDLRLRPSSTLSTAATTVTTLLYDEDFPNKGGWGCLGTAPAPESDGPPAVTRTRAAHAVSTAVPTVRPHLTLERRRRYV
jgi:hypothetical protein